MTTAPTLNGQIIGQTERATRAVFDLVLVDIGIPFETWVALNLTATSGELAHDALVHRLGSGLQISPNHAVETVADARSRDLLTDDDIVRPTAAGRAAFEQVTAGIAGIAERLYGDVPTADLVTARRVLELVTARALAELAAAG